MLVNRQQVLEHWVERLTGFEELTEKDIDRIGVGLRNITGISDVDVAIIRGPAREEVVSEGFGGELQPPGTR